MTHIEPSSTRLAHLSDVHLPPPSPLPSWHHFLNKRALSLASWKRHRMHHHLRALSDAVIADIAASSPDMLLNTGDLTNFGLKEEFETGASWLASMPAPSWIVPGNHDAMVREPWSQGGALWSPWMEEAKPDTFPYCRRIGDIALIGINSACPTPPFMACGRVGQAQRKRLAEILDATSTLCRVVMIHHPPRAGLVPWRKSLLDHHAVSAVLAHHGAAIVLHGHSHDATRTVVPGSTIPLIGTASASLSSSKPWRQAGWNNLSIARQDSKWSITLTTRQYTTETGWRSLAAGHWLIPTGKA